MKKILLIGIILFGNITLLFGQNVNSMFERSEQLFQEEKYEEAVVLLESLKPYFKPNTEGYATIINFLGVNYFLMGNFSNAESCLLEAKVIREKKLGKKHPDYLISLDNLRILYVEISNFEKAEKFYLEFLQIRKKFLGKNHPDYATILNDVGLFYYNIGNYLRAKKIFFEAKTVRRKVLGEKHPDYATSLHNLGEVYDVLGFYDIAEKFYIEAKEIREKILGKEHPSYARSLKNLGWIYCMMENYDKALKYYLEAKDIRERVLGKEHPDYASSLNNLGEIYNVIGCYDKAEKYYLEAKEIREKTLGKEHLSYSNSLYNLGSLYREIDDFANSEKCFLEAITIRGKILGKEHPLYATALGNMGNLYKDVGDYDKAEKLYLEAKDILEKAVGMGKRNYATTLNNLGNLYRDKGDYTNAFKYLFEALEMEEKNWGTNASYAIALGNLGNSCGAMGNYDRAVKYIIEALSILEKIYGKEHPSYASFLNNLGYFYSIIGNNDKAIKNYLDAIKISEKVLGREHSDYAFALGNLGIFYFKLGQHDKFDLLIQEAYDIETKKVIKNFAFLSNRKRELFWEQKRNKYEYSYSFAYFHPANSMTALTYDNTLFTKGLMLRTANEIRDVIYTSGNADLITNFEQLGNIRQQITALQTKATPDLNWISTLESRADSLDKALTIASSEYREFKEDLTVGWNDIQKHLKPNEVAIEFVNFKLFNKQITSTDSVMYCAMLIRKDSDMPEFIPLFEQSQLVESLQSKGVTFVERIENLYKGGSHFFNGQKLYNLIWEPLEKHLEGIETVYYSPSGLLNRISFEAIPVDSLCLIDKYNLQLLSSTREIVHKSKKQEEFLPLLHAVIYGGIAYDIEDATQLISLVEKYKTSETEHFASRSIPNDSTRSAGWSYLQGTETEVNEIEKLLQQSNIHITKYMGAEANEESFKNLSGKSPELLHIATHGFFLENEKKIRENPFMQMISENSSSRSVSNPLLRSGLLFAGANRAWTNKEVIAGIEDGILTAEEIASLNLTRTKLVVLSACKTALGDVDNSEGVFGLQRSFKLAGVETLVMSLWDVSDRVTCQFMLTFYQNLLDGKTKLESFHTAQKQIREEYKNPYYWAAFVMMD